MVLLGPSNIPIWNQVKDILITILILLLSFPLFGQSSKPLGVVLPPIFMGNLSKIQIQFLLETLDDDAYKKIKDIIENQVNESIKLAESISNDLNGEQKFVRGFFAGGTLCYESKIILEQMIGKVYSNLSLDDEYYVKGNASSKENTLVDFGEEEFTSARPHPIIDPLLRRNRILKDANDPNVGVVIIDIICGINAAKIP